MKYLIKKLLTCMMWCIGRGYPYSLSARLCEIRDTIYTMWIRNFVGAIGVNSRISYPCHLEGDGFNNLVIGSDVQIHEDCVIGCRCSYRNQSFSPRIIIGNNCSIGAYNQLSSINRIIVGDGFLSGRFVYIGDNSHGSLSSAESTVTPAERELVSKGEVVIGENVWLGDKVTVLAGVHIGDNVIVAANAVVTKNVPSNCVIAGVPAKIVKTIS